MKIFDIINLMRVDFSSTYTYKFYQLVSAQVEEFISTLGVIVTYCWEFLKGLKNFNTTFKDIIEQCSRFAVSSLPITLSIVGMTSIIIAMQVAGEMVKQGGGNFVGMFNQPYSLIVRISKAIYNPINADTVKEKIKKLKENGKTIIIVTHDLEFAAECSDRCALLFRGKIVSVEETKEFFVGNSFYTTSANKMTRGFLDGIVTLDDLIEADKAFFERQGDI